MADDPSETVEISRAHLATYQRGLNILNKLWDDPDVGLTVKKAAKKADPSIRVPEIDIAEPLMKPINDRLTAAEAENKKLREEIEADRKTRKDAEAEHVWMADWNTVVKRHGLTEDGQKEVAALMKSRGIGDPEAGAALWASKQPKPQPISGPSYAPADMNLYGIDGASADDKVKLLHSSPMKFFDQEVAEILREGSEAA